MAAISCFGEALVDILITSSPQGNEPEHREQFPGGAPANVAAAVAKLGGEARFIGQVGNDDDGHFVTQALVDLGVDTRNLLVHPTAKTAAAFVRLDDKGERRFEFNRENTADLLITELDIKDKWFMAADIFHFCSNTLTEPGIATTTLAALNKAKKQGCLISFDVNLRHNLWPNQQADIQTIESCLPFVDFIKISKDEIEYLSPNDEVAFVKMAVGAGVSTVIITDGANTIKVLARGIYSEITPPAAKVVDSTAAGDAFTGGFLFALSEQKDVKKSLTDQQQLEQMTLFAAKCGAYAVTKAGAFTSLPTLDDLDTEATQ